MIDLFFLKLLNPTAKIKSSRKNKQKVTDRTSNLRKANNWKMNKRYKSYLKYSQGFNLLLDRIPRLTMILMMCK